MASTVPCSKKDVDDLIMVFIAASAHTGLTVHAKLIRGEFLAAPHKPSKLPFRKHAIYWFSVGDRCLKVGKSGPQSAARYTSQHYNPRSSPSNLAKSILSNRDRLKAVIHPEMQIQVDGLDELTVGKWIKQKTSRCNLIVDLAVNDRALSFLETFIQARLQPLFEGRLG